MKTKYYAWKDGKKKSGKQDWTELTPSEFIELCNDNRNLDKEKRRYFYQLPGFEPGDCYYYLECTYEQFLKSRAEKDERTRKRKEEETLKAQGQWYATISLDAPFEDETGDVCSLHDMIPDPDSCFEDSLILSMDVMHALSYLDPDELEIIERLYLSEYAVSEKKLAEQMNVPRRTLGCKKKRILSKLKKSFATF